MRLRPFLVCAKAHYLLGLKIFVIGLILKSQIDDEKLFKLKNINKSVCNCISYVTKYSYKVVNNNYLF